MWGVGGRGTRTKHFYTLNACEVPYRPAHCGGSGGEGRPQEAKRDRAAADLGQGTRAGAALRREGLKKGWDGAPPITRHGPQKVTRAGKGRRAACGQRCGEQAAGSGGAGAAGKPCVRAEHAEGDAVAQGAHGKVNVVLVPLPDLPTWARLSARALRYSRRYCSSSSRCTFPAATTSSFSAAGSRGRLMDWALGAGRTVCQRLLPAPPAAECLHGLHPAADETDRSAGQHATRATAAVKALFRQPLLATRCCGVVLHTAGLPATAGGTLSRRSWCSSRRSVFSASPGRRTISAGALGQGRTCQAVRCCLAGAGSQKQAQRGVGASRPAPNTCHMAGVHARRGRHLFWQQPHRAARRPVAGGAPPPPRRPLPLPRPDRRAPRAPAAQWRRSRQLRQC